MANKNLEKLVKQRNADRSDFDVATDGIVSQDEPVRDTKYVALLPKQTWKDLMKIATMTNVSANEYVNVMIREFVAEHQEDVAKYDKAFGTTGKYS